MITPGYFRLFGVAPTAGRMFDDRDGPDNLPVAIVNERVVRLFFAGRDPIGRRIKLGRDSEPWRTIVGVVPDMHLGGAIGRIDPQNEGVYLPLRQETINFITLIARTQGAPERYAAAIQAQINTIDPMLPLYWVRSLDKQYQLDTWVYRAFGTLFMAFGFAALALAVIGLYGVMSFSVGQRTREIGVRMALGAQARSVRWLVLRQGGVQLAIGLLFGVGLAALLSRGLGILLFNVRPWDPSVFTIVVATLAASGLVACLVPARRATHVQPIEALRYE